MSSTRTGRGTRWGGRRTSLSLWLISWGLVLLWTNPTTNTDGTPLTDLAGIRVEGSREDGSFSMWTDMPVGAWADDSTYHPRTGPGLADSTEVTVPLRKRQEDWWQFWVQAYDSSGNYSEKSNIVRVSLTASPGPITGVEGGALPPGVIEWYDVHGRRIDRPIASGVYFRRRGSVTDKVVILK